MITEATINSVIERMNQDSSESNQDKSLSRHQTYLEYLQQDSSVLFDEEAEYLLGIVFVLLESCDVVIEDIEALVAIEETNWEVVQSHKRIKAAFDIFFDGYSEEDLLAYVEDSLSVDPEAEEEFEFLTEVGIEFMVVKAKSVIDYYIKHNT